MGLLAALNGVARYLGRAAARLLGFAAPGAAGGLNGPAYAETLAWLRERFAEDVRDNFVGGHDPDGRAWAPLKWRAGRPLILTGLLMNSAYLAAQNVELRNGTELLATLAAPAYWMFHEYGTRRIPARPFFGPSPETVRGLADRVARDMADELGGDAG
jgi:phage gpG-like protein